VGNCRYCGSPLKFAEDVCNYICGSCLSIVDRDIMPFNNFIGTNINPINYNQNTINDIIRKEREIEEYRKELLSNNRSKKVAKK
jgi:hypothetical protein